MLNTELPSQLRGCITFKNNNPLLLISTQIYIDKKQWLNLFIRVAFKIWFTILHAYFIIIVFLIVLLFIMVFLVLIFLKLLFFLQFLFLTFILWQLIGVLLFFRLSLLFFNNIIGFIAHTGSQILFFGKNAEAVSVYLFSHLLGDSVDCVSVFCHSLSNLLLLSEIGIFIEKLFSGINCQRHWALLIIELTSLYNTIFYIRTDVIFEALLIQTH